MAKEHQRSEIDYNSNLLDVFRIFATLQVFLGHVVTHFSISAAVNVVYFVRGVPILFVLCGFLAAKSISARGTKPWLIRRAVRVIPAFWVCILVNTFIILAVYNTKPSVKEFIIYFATQFLGLNFYTGEWLRGYGVGTPNGVLWTIGVQIQFFLIVPLIHRCMKQKRFGVWCATIGGLMILSIICNRSMSFLPDILGKLINVTVIPYLYFLMLGMMAWYFRDRLIPLLAKYKWWLVLAYVAWGLAEIFFQFPHLFDGNIYNTVTTVLLGCIIFAFAFSGKWRMRHDWTYGFYLYHMVFINLAIEVGYGSLQPIWQWGITMFSIIALTLLFAILSQRLVEKPIAALIERKL